MRPLLLCLALLTLTACRPCELVPPGCQPPAPAPRDTVTK